MMIAELCDKPLDLQELISRCRSDEDGAVSVFWGVVRNHADDKKVDYLEYSAYPDMAIKKTQQIMDEAAEKFGVERIGVQHRMGRLEIGEASIAIVVASPHRGPALEATSFLINRIKEEVPIWKKEVFEDGSRWVGLHA